MEKNYVFRYHEGATGEDWFTSKVYGAKEIEEIKDPSGGSDRSEITSIPSPFARIDLVLTAFKYVVDNKSLDGNTIYHKMVSHALDVGHIFFRFNDYKEKVRIVRWSEDEHLKMISSDKNRNISHKLLGETYELFLAQDENSYNFDINKEIFFIVNESGTIIGGTSPATLFFSSPNILGKDKIGFGDYKLFYIPEENEKDYIYPSLYVRDPGYLKYLKYFFTKYSEITAKKSLDLDNPLSIIKNYIELNIKKLSDKPKLLAELNDRNKDKYDSEYTQLDTGKEGEIVRICGFPLRAQKPGAPLSKSSDFVIKSVKYKGSKPPLVLQNNYIKKLFYISSYWKENTKVPYYPIDQDGKYINFDVRVLPNEDYSYPWLTITDFLEPYLIKVPFKINDNNFFVLKTKKISKSDYLIPINPLFFDFFEINDLNNQHKDGKQWIELIPEVGDAVTVKLRIPINKLDEYITFERTYYETIDIPDLPNNKGVIKEFISSVVIFPPVKTSEEQIKPHYRVILIDRDLTNISKNYNLEIYSTKSIEPITINEKDIVKRNTKKPKGSNYSSTYYVINKNFDYILISDGNSSGLIVPKFKDYTFGNDTYSFAVDFGTIYSHIEYRVGDKSPVPFEIDWNDIQVATLHDANNSDFGNFKEIQTLINHEFIPEIIKKDQEYQFPQRTVIGYNRFLDFRKSTQTLAHFNIPFIYEKDDLYNNLKIQTHLKWSDFFNDNSDDQKFVKAFLETLLFLIRNKVMINQGDLTKTCVLWSFPSSMSPNRRDKLTKLWQDLFTKYISSEIGSNLIQVSESIAPFYYYARKLKVDAGNKPALSIDIGGETVDIVVFKSQTPLLLSSFRYGASSIYGDGYAGAPGNNGFVCKYKKKIRELLRVNNYDRLINILDELNKLDKSDNIIAFFFSLERNHLISNPDQFSFNKMLSQDEDLKIVFLLYYLSIIYHSVKLIKKFGLDAPQFITFSGTGSKLLDIIDLSQDDVLGEESTDKIKRFKRLPDLTQILINKCYNIKNSKVDIRSYHEPKEITAKGSLYYEFNEEIEGIKLILLGDDQDTLIKGNENVLYDNLLMNPKIQPSVLTEIKSFLDLILELNKDYSFETYFGVNNEHLKIAIDIINENMSNYLDRGITSKSDILKVKDRKKEKLNETLFFYPFIGALNNIAYQIVTK